MSPRKAVDGTARRRLHAGAWWLWALALAVAASNTTNPWLLGLTLAVAGYVVVSCRGQEPRASSFRVFFVFGMTVIAIRLVFHVLLGGVDGEVVLFTLPSATLPEWAQGIRLGGPVTAEGVLFSFYDGLRLATLLACVGAANALADPKRMMKSLPAALYEVSVAVVVALAVAPQLVTSVTRINRARALRGDDARGLRRIGRVFLLVLHEALERSMALAASMDSRGYGRRATAQRRAVPSLLMFGGVVFLVVALAGLVGSLFATTMVVLLCAAGAGLIGVGLWLSGQRQIRTRYRPDPWQSAEWLVVGAGCAAVAASIVGHVWGVADMTPAVAPPHAPGLPIVPAVGVMLAVIPSVVAARRAGS